MFSFFQSWNKKKAKTKKLPGRRVNSSLFKHNLKIQWLFLPLFLDAFLALSSLQARLIIFLLFSGSATFPFIFCVQVDCTSHSFFQKSVLVGSVSFGVTWKENAGISIHKNTSDSYHWSSEEQDFQITVCPQ